MVFLEKKETTFNNDIKVNVLRQESSSWILLVILFFYFFIFKIFFLMFYLFLRQRETEHEWGGSEREGDTESEAGSRL